MRARFMLIRMLYRAAAREWRLRALMVGAE
jgi:hypothetical protein